ncbi:hypothetical protein N665_0448s0032 [Sinapis alba]|nr:hypothetical protein N665_0448s0032 [Sinapis alba]
MTAEEEGKYLEERKLLFPSKNLAASQRTHLDLAITSATVVFVFYEVPTIRHLKRVNTSILISVLETCL